MVNRKGKNWKQWQISFSLAPKSWQKVTVAMILKKMFSPWKECYDKTRQCITKQKHHFADKGPYGQSYDFSRSHVWMWELDHKEGWVPRNRCLQIVVLMSTLDSPLDCKEIRPVHPKGNQPWIFIGRTDDWRHWIFIKKIEAGPLILCSPDGKSQLIGKDSDPWKDWMQKEKKVTEV